MIEGIILSFVISLLICAIILFVTEMNYDVWRPKKHYLRNIFCVLIIVIVTTIGASIGINIYTEEYNKYIRTFDITKETIENAMKNNEISDLEKIAIVNEIILFNCELENKKTNVNYWWNWFLDDSKINSLESIHIK